MRSTKKLKNFYKTTALIGAGILSQAVFTAAMAQNDTIVVTATRRAQNVQDVPIAVTAINSEELERAGIRDVRDLARLSSSFVTSNSQDASTTNFRLRGVGTTGNNIGLESSVGVFIDGVYLSRPGVALGDLIDVEQIEVLRGPQGTLFGRNTSAGALSIATKKPNLSEVEGFANASYGNYDFVNFQGGLSFPLIEDVLGFRIAGSTQNRDGFLTSTTGATSNDRDRYSLKAQILWEPSDFVSLRIIGDYSKVDEACCDAVFVRETPLVALGAYAAAGLTGAAGAPAGPAVGLDTLTSNGEQFLNPFDQWGFSAELNWDMGFGTMTYIPSYRDFTAFSLQQTDFVSLDMFAATVDDEITTMTHELRFQGTAMNDRLDWLIGGYYSEEDITRQVRLELGADWQRNGSALLIAGGVNALGANPLLVLAQGVSADGNFADNLYTQNSQSFSFFTHNIFHLTDRLDLTAGVRYVDETKDGSFAQLASTPLAQNACFNVITNPALTNPLSPLAPLFPNAVGLTCFPFSTTADFNLLNPAFGALPTPRTFADTFEDDEFVYTFNLNYQLTDNINTYGSYTHGFKSGGFNLDSTAAALGADPRFNSEEVNAIELGLKSNLANGRLRANLALFHMDMSDFQVLEFTGIQFTTFNVPKVKSTGAELEVLASVSDNLTLNAALTYADARYPDDCDAGSVPAAVIARVSNLCGAKLTSSPDFVAVFGGTFETQISDTGWSAFLTASTRYESDRRTSTQPSNPATGTPVVLDIQEAHAKIDARLGFFAPDNRYGIEFWAKNITDQHTRAVTFNIPLRGTGDVSARGAFTQDPRTYGVTVRGQF